jgi:hypothetical protein
MMIDGFARLSPENSQPVLALQCSSCAAALTEVELGDVFLLGLECREGHRYFVPLVSPGRGSLGQGAHDSGTALGVGDRIANHSRLAHRRTVAPLFEHVPRRDTAPHPRGWHAISGTRHKVPPMPSVLRGTLGEWHGHEWLAESAGFA